MSTQTSTTSNTSTVIIGVVSLAILLIILAIWYSNSSKTAVNTAQNTSAASTITSKINSYKSTQPNMSTPLLNEKLTTLVVLDSPVADPSKNTAGTGKEIQKGGKGKLHYTGYLADGTVFQSSKDGAGQPFEATIGVGQLIKGWDVGVLAGEGHTAMKEGGIRTLKIPADMAYGARATSGIPANSDLVFEIELVQVL